MKSPLFISPLILLTLTKVWPKEIIGKVVGVGLPKTKIGVSPATPRIFSS